jgi:hypothetical protein
MSSIGEAKERIGTASESADRAKEAVESAATAVEDATEAVNQAAGDSGHEKIEEALGAFKEVSEKLAEIAGLISKGQAAADAYAESLG